MDKSKGDGETIPENIVMGASVGHTTASVANMLKHEIHRYPRLVYAPDQHGDFVATEDNGTDVREIAAAVAGGESRDDAARRFHTTAEHVKDALRWVEDHPPSDAGPSDAGGA